MAVIILTIDYTSKGERSGSPFLKRIIPLQNVKGMRGPGRS